MLIFSSTDYLMLLNKVYPFPGIHDFLLVHMHNTSDLENFCQESLRKLDNEGHDENHSQRTSRSHSHLI